METINSKRLDKIMKEKNMTNEYLAAASGIASHTIGKMRNGEYTKQDGTPRKSSPSTIRAIAEVLEVDPDYLAGKIRQRTKAEAQAAEKSEKEFNEMEKIMIKKSACDRCAAIMNLCFNIGIAFHEKNVKTISGTTFHGKHYKATFLIGYDSFDLYDTGSGDLIRSGYPIEEITKLMSFLDPWIEGGRAAINCMLPEVLGEPEKYYYEVMSEKAEKDKKDKKRRH